MGTGLNTLFCCGGMSAMYSPFDDVFDIIDRDCSPFSPPGLRRESRDEQCASPDRNLTNTPGNALYDAPPPPQPPQRVSVIVPGRVSSGETIYVNFLDENNKPKTVAASAPPNSYPGMQFFVEIPTSPKINQKEPVPVV